MWLCLIRHSLKINNLAVMHAVILDIYPAMDMGMGPLM